MTSEEVKVQLHHLVDTLPVEMQPTALSALQTLLNRGVTAAGPLTQLLGVKLDIENGRHSGTLIVEPHMLNPLGIAHGAVPYALMDTVCGIVALSVSPTPRFVTQDLHYRYHGPARLGLIQAEAEALHIGSRTIVIRGHVHQDERLIGSATATFAILNQDEVHKLQQGE